MRSVLLVCSVSFAFSFAALHAQTSDQPAQVVGRVLDANSHAPIAGARVTLVRSSGAADRRAPQTAVSDRNGDFAFAAVLPGRFVLSARNAGYVFDAPTEPLELTPGQTVAVDVFLAPGGVVTGRILSERGGPASNVRVNAVSRRLPFRGDRFTIGGAHAITNRLGEFRIAGLGDGEYLIMAIPLPNAPNNRAGILEANTQMPTYYPGTTRESDADSVPVRVGETISGLEFRLVHASLVRITGIVVDEAGQPVSEAKVAVRPRLPNAPRGFVSSTFVRANPDGTFEINGLRDGVYGLTAVRLIRSQVSPGTVFAVLDHTLEGTEQQITVDGSGATGLRLVVQTPRQEQE